MQTQRKTEEPYILNERNLQQDQIKTEIAFYFDLEEWQNHWKKFWCSYALANGSVWCSENKIVVWIYYATVDTNVIKSDLPRTSCKVSFRFVPSKIIIFLYFPFSFPWAYTIFCSRKSEMFQQHKAQQVNNSLWGNP